MIIFGWLSIGFLLALVCNWCLRQIDGSSLTWGAVLACAIVSPLGPALVIPAVVWFLCFLCDDDGKNSSSWMSKPVFKQD